LPPDIAVSLRLTDRAEIKLPEAKPHKKEKKTFSGKPEAFRHVLRRKRPTIDSFELTLRLNPVALGTR